jgi:hypothetical protein
MLPSIKIERSQRGLLLLGSPANRMRVGRPCASVGPKTRRLLAGSLLSALKLAAASAQSLEPRAYSPNPVGANFALAGYAYQTGGIVFDASLPFSDVTAKINAASLGYVRTFSLFGRSASAGLAVPYAWGSVEGEVNEEQRRITRSGFADLQSRLTVNLLGGPALTPAEFAARPPATTLGFTLVAVAPTGEYFPDKLINIGANRWAFKTELGFSQPAGKWAFEAYAGTWFFTANDDFFGGQVRTQKPVFAFQGHVSYTFRQRLWLAASATYYTGGQSSLDGVPRADLQKNTRVSLTGSVPLGRRQSLKLFWSKGATTSIGADFTTYAVTYQFLWFDRDGPPVRASGR